MRRLVDLSPIRVRLVRRAGPRSAANARGRQPGFPWMRPLAAAAALCALGAATAAPVSAATNGGTTATINIATRSITVSPTTTTLDICLDNSGNATGSVLTFPNGNCRTSGSGTVTITNGTAPGHIDIQGANAVPADSGTNWTLCTLGTSACTGFANDPGQDQFAERSNASTTTSYSPYLTTIPQCDTAFAPPSSCAATSSLSQTESLNVYGPSSSTDTSSSFTTVWTWTAVP